MALSSPENYYAEYLIGRYLEMNADAEDETFKNKIFTSILSNMESRTIREQSIQQTLQQMIENNQVPLIPRISASSETTFISSRPHLIPFVSTNFSFPSNWTSTAASSPVSSPLHTPSAISPALNTRSMSRNSIGNSSVNNNNKKINNNNLPDINVDKVGKKGIKKRKMTLTSNIETSTNETIKTISSPSGSPEVMKDGKSKVFICETCNRGFGYKHVLQNHQRTHTGEKPFQCPQCNKKFTRDHHLKTHMRLHTGEKPYHCTQCSRQFVQVANLRRHLRVHTGERPYNCEYCSSKFSDSNQLKSHLLIHKGEKPFQCKNCLSRFRRRHHMLAHKCGNGSNAEIPEYDSDEDDDVDIDIKKKEKRTCVTSARIPVSLSTPISLPLNIAAIPQNLPMQTEPEDLSMSTGACGQSPVSSTPNSNGNDSSNSALSMETTVHKTSTIDQKAEANMFLVQKIEKLSNSISKHLQ